MDKEFEDVVQSSPIARLKRAWINEMFSPEILMFEDDVVQAVREAKIVQEAQIEAATARDAFTANMLRMDLDRGLYILKAYFRIRLVKIERFALHLLKDREARSRLSLEEENFAMRFVDLFERHCRAAFLDKLPAKLRELSTQSAEVDMIPTPYLGAHVFVRALVDIASYSLGEIGSVPIRQGAIYVLPYDPIRPLLQDGSVEML
eukprot:Amastigsp_a510853_14.p2 type:complete len:205 gc:universal Amastigsp_a510853_14:769-155(-)